jgi:hypothetical protein
MAVSGTKMVQPQIMSINKLFNCILRLHRGPSDVCLGLLLLASKVEPVYIPQSWIVVYWEDTTPIRIPIYDQLQVGSNFFQALAPPSNSTRRLLPSESSQLSLTTPPKHG